MIATVSFTCKTKKEAKKIVRALLKKKLIACANIFVVDSLYRWKGRVAEEKEVKVEIKTAKSSMDKTVKEIKKMHSYKVAAITIQNAAVTDECLEWIKEVTLQNSQ